MKFQIFSIDAIAGVSLCGGTTSDEYFLLYFDSDEVDILRNLRDIRKDRWSHFETAPESVLGREFSTFESARSTVVGIMKSRWSLLELDWPHTTQQELDDAAEMVRDRLGDTYQSAIAPTGTRLSSTKIATDDLASPISRGSEYAEPVFNESRNFDDSPLGRKPVLIGRVTSAKRSKSIQVEIVTKRKHRKYKKYINTRTKLHVHDEQNDCQTGDVVMIRECRPISKSKHHELIQICGHRPSPPVCG